MYFSARPVLSLGIIKHSRLTSIIANECWLEASPTQRQDILKLGTFRVRVENNGFLIHPPSNEIRASMNCNSKEWCELLGLVSANRCMMRARNK